MEVGDWDDGWDSGLTGGFGCNDLWRGWDPCLELGRHATTGLWACMARDRCLPVMVTVTRGSNMRKGDLRLRRWSHSKDSCTDIHWTRSPAIVGTFLWCLWKQRLVPAECPKERVTDDSLGYTV